MSLLSRFAIVGALSFVGVTACGQDSEIPLHKGSGGASDAAAGTGGAGVGGASDASSGGASTCGTSSQCVNPTPFCSPSLARCVECINSANCSSGEACGPAGTCITGCTTESQCASYSLTPHCDLSFDACVQCVTDSNCTSSDDSLCVEGHCRECRNDGDCATKDDKHFCELGSHECRQCLVDGHCQPGQYCSPTDYQCYYDS